jgi:NAD(P)-dependent dehydrogenase (short-subunit alcohol dehydrogenase family)
MRNNRTEASTLERDFVGKSALIVGGTSGIGKAVARLLLERGAVSVIVAGRNVEKLHAAESELSAFGRVVGREVDITNQTELARVLGESGNQFDGVDLLVNAAGVFLPRPFLEQTMEDYDRYLELNRGTFFITQTVARGMAGRAGGSIVNVGSMWARQAIEATPSSAYSMAKAGLHALTQHLALELAHANIRVKCSFSCGGRDADLRDIHSKGSGSRSPTGLQWFSPDWTDRKA